MVFSQPTPAHQEFFSVWRINMRTQQLSIEPVPESWNPLGGRGLLAQVLLDEIDPACSPLGPGNKLVFASGLLVGHMLSSCDRISIGAKSPLTRGIKRATRVGAPGYKWPIWALKP